MIDLVIFQWVTLMQLKNKNKKKNHINTVYLGIILGDTSNGQIEVIFTSQESLLEE